MPMSGRRESLLLAAALAVLPALAGAENSALSHALRQALSVQRSLQSGGAAGYNTLLLYEGAGTVLHQAPTAPPANMGKFVKNMSPQEFVDLMRRTTLDFGAVLYDPLLGPKSRGIAMTDPAGKRLLFIVPDAANKKLHNFVEFVVVISRREFISYVLDDQLKFQDGYHVTVVKGETPSTHEIRSEEHREPNDSDRQNLIQMLKCWRDEVVKRVTRQEKPKDSLPLPPGKSGPTI